MTFTSQVAPLVALVVLSLAGFAQTGMRAGLWENTVTARGQTITHKACITSEQEKLSKGSVESMRAATEKALEKTPTCKITEFSVTGNVSTVVMTCAKETTKRVTTITGDMFRTVATSTRGGETQTAIFTGKRIGNCPAGGVQ